MALNQEIVNFAFWTLGIVDETKQPTPLQSASALITLNDMLLNEAADGLRLGWYTQTNLAATAPLRDADIAGVKYMLCASLAPKYNVSLATKPELVGLIAESVRQLTKRSIRYFESDLSELQRPQGGPWGGPNWI
jgi:hypothetical protein